MNTTGKKLLKICLKPINILAILQVLLIGIVGCYKLTFDIKVEEIRGNLFSNNIIISIPGFEEALQSQEKRKLFPPIDVSMAMDIFYIEWYATFGDYRNIIEKNLNSMFIEWTDAKRTFQSGYTVEGKSITNGTANGLAYKKNHIWVCTRANEGEPYLISKTSFVHELVHASINALSGGKNRGDPDHEGERYEGWTLEHTFFIDKANESLREMGL